jgi:cation transport regulator ChaB
MPFASNDELPKGVKSLPPEQQTKWRKVFNAAYEGTCKDSSDRDQCASKVAWSQISGKYKGDALVEFSMSITRVVHTKEDIFRWKSVVSDTFDDAFNDQMSLDLFRDFVQRIEINELAPENFRSTFWNGGMPYLSVSHYSDLEGKAVPGTVEAVFIDGVQLHARGQFSKTELGMACYNAIFKDLYTEPRIENPVRVSIAFLDFGHVHRSNNYTFIRENVSDICPECVEEMNNGEYPGKVYLKGQLIHFALTRVPANDRTSMEVDRAMATTRKQDAASIIGEELAEQIDDESLAVGKSMADALVIRSDDEVLVTDSASEVTDVESVAQDIEAVNEAKSKKATDDPECADDDEDDSDENDSQKKKSVVIEDAVTKKEGDCAHPSSHYLVVEDSTKPTTWHLRVKGCDGKPDHRLMGAAWASLHGGYRGNKYSGPNKDTATGKLKRMYKSEGLDAPSKSIFEENLDYRLDEIEKSLTEIAASARMVPEPSLVRPVHELDSALELFKSAYDEARSQELPIDDKLRMLQDSFQKLGDQVIENIRSSVELRQEPSTNQVDLVQQLSIALADALRPIATKLDLVAAQMQNNVVKSIQQQPEVAAIPGRRSISPNLSMQSEIRRSSALPQKSSETPKLRAMIEQNFKRANGLS